MQQTVMTYGTFQANTPSDTAGVNCRAIFIGGAGTITVSKDLTTAGVTLTVVAGQILPIMLDQGRILATGTTATLIVTLA